MVSNLVLLDLRFGSLCEPVSGRRWARDEILRRAAARTAFFGREGLSAGDRVFIHYGNRLEFFADLVAAWHLGACVVPIDPRLTGFEVEMLARAASPRLALVDDENGAAASALRAVPNMNVISTLALEDGGASLPPSRLRLDDDALILFTSGSTGAPKGVVHTHRSLRARWTALRDHLGVTPYRRTLCLLPTHFGHGLICNSLFPWLSGQDLFITPAFSSELLMRLGVLIDEHKITCLSSVPSIWGLVLKVARAPALATLARIHCGSAPLSANLWKQVQAWGATREVFNTYGITETGSWAAGMTDGEFTPEDGLIGKPWGGVIRILKTSADPSAPDAECATAEAGDVWIHTPALMKGYLDREDLTRQAVHGGWFATDDIGIVDERGVLYLKGRKREEINKGGMKIYPADVEAVVEQFDATIQAVTFGIDDPLYGQDVAIALALEDKGQKAVAGLYQWMKAHLAEFKMPRRWYILESIPRSSRGKVNRNDIKQQCSSLVPLDVARILRGSEPGPS